ncbi:hypothetical protein B0T14DRAFT_567568 [Immersiella caudata]|uniref:Uncharacterized protein n=1 Tax=Immersiella caudata TaxID=314043 RepID=A0AA39WSM3_9PEZI|nr:hypothetical protein B0T14DRAFT_567568 [Immersiella caudata]
MGKGIKALKQFIDEILDSDLKGLPTSGGTIYIYQWRFQAGHMTSSGEYNLQVRINRGTSISTWKKFDSVTAAGPVLVPASESWSPSRIKEKLRGRS